MNATIGLPEQDTILSLREASTYMGTSIPLTRSLAQKGGLKVIRLGTGKNSKQRFRLSDIRAFLEKNTTTTK